MKRERERVKLCVTLYSIATLQPPVEAVTHLTLFLPPLPLHGQGYYLKLSLADIEIS